MDLNGPLIALDLPLNLCPSESDLTDEELLHVLNQCGPTLKYLYISCTYSSGDNLSEYKGSLLLQTLKCEESELLDRGLLNILRLCRSTLEFLDIRNSEVSGSDLWKF